MGASLNRVSGLAAMLAALAVSCSDPVSHAHSSDAAIAVRVRVIQAAAKSSVAELVGWDTLVVRVVSRGGDTLRHATPLAAGTQVASDTIANVPAQDNLVVDAFTVSRQGWVVHRSVPQTVDLSPGEVQAVELWLTPCCGSLAIALDSIPAAVDTVAVRFASDNGSVVREVRGKPAGSRYSASLDGIPDSAAGTLSVAYLGISRDTLYRGQTRLVFDVDANVTISLRFGASPSGLALAATVVEPGVTLVSGHGVSGDSLTDERGPLVISEIMYMANDSEYVELYNPTAADTSFDTLILDVDGARRVFTNITVPSRDFFVIGRRAMPWVDVFHATTSALDLSSTNGNTLTLRTKRLQVIDWVAFSVKTNALGWPNIPSAKAAIVLDSLPLDPRYNNYGPHWKVATSTIATTTQRGTPGSAGL